VAVDEQRGDHWGNRPQPPKANRSKTGLTQATPRQQGPAEAAAPLAECPANIVFILLDEMG
jgi:hypothetical protein